MICRETRVRGTRGPTNRGDERNSGGAAPLRRPHHRCRPRDRAPRIGHAGLLRRGPRARSRVALRHASCGQHRRGVDRQRRRPGIPERPRGVVVGGVGGHRHAGARLLARAAHVARRQGALAAHRRRLPGAPLRALGARFHGRAPLDRHAGHPRGTADRHGLDPGGRGGCAEVAGSRRRGARHDGLLHGGRTPQFGVGQPGAAGRADGRVSDCCAARARGSGRALGGPGECTRDAGTSRFHG